MSIPLLPRLNDNNRIAITKRGVWQSELQNTLKNLVNDLKVTADNKSDITSIPDLWARPAMYEMVLFNKHHHLHQKFVSEWRGILAMLALREIRNYKAIDSIELVLPSMDKISDEDPNFLRAVVAMLPQEYKEYKNETGDKIQIIVYNEKPLAIVWPSILVCPAVGLENTIDRTVSWWTVSGIGDPIAFLSEQEKALLVKWLDNVINGLGNDIKAADLIELLQNFQNDMANEEKISGFAVGTSMVTGYCEAIGRAVRNKVDKDTFLSTSNVILVNKRNTQAKNLLVMSRDLYKQWNKATSDIVVAGNINLDAALPFGDVLFSGQESKLNEIDLHQFNAELRMGSDFFTEKICLIPGSKDAFPGALVNKKLNYTSTYNVLLPVKKELLDYLDPVYISNNINIDVVNDVDIHVEMEIPLSGFDANGKLLKIEKTYKGARSDDEWENDIIFLQLPLIQIWPNFIPYNSRDWQAYYSYYDTLGANTFKAEPLWKVEDTVTRELDLESGFRAEVVKGSSFPEGYSCTKRFSTNRDDKNIEIGIVLIKQPEKLTLTSNNICKIGIDFGTTNSLAFMSLNGKKEMIKYQNRLFAVTGYDDYSARPELRRHFFTTSEQPTGDTLSIRTLFNPNFGEFPQAEENQPVFPGVVYYLDDIDNISVDKNYTHLVEGRMMKWDGDGGHGIEYMKNFLLHMGLQCMAEAVANGATHIDWIYSFPGSFSNGQKRTLGEIWNNVLEAFSGICPNLVNKEIQRKTESIAMAEFFKDDMNATFTRGIVCMDIGGGSTDIAIWRGNDSVKPQAQCSLKFAGLDILNNPLFVKRSILQKFMGNDTDFNNYLIEVIQKEDFGEFNERLEVILKYKEKLLFRSLVSKSVNDDVKLFTRNVAFALAGIFFYTGVLVGDLKIENKLDNCLPHCYIGGNGSKLLDWVDNGNYTPNSQFRDVFAMCLAAGAYIRTQDITEDDVIRLQIKKSPRPKAEVAYGLVCQSAVNEYKEVKNTAGNGFNPLKRRGQATGSVEDMLLSGEKIYIGGQINEGVRVTLEDVKKGISIVEDMPTFISFVEVFNNQMADLGFTGKFQINFTRHDLDDIRDQTNDVFDVLRYKEEGKINLEPPFIILLKNAMKVLSKK